MFGPTRKKPYNHLYPVRVMIVALAFHDRKYMHCVSILRSLGFFVVV